MSSTIITGKRAFAMLANNGTIYYLLAEEGHCSNVYPHTPRWSATYFGPIEGALQRIFQCGADFEGGMLKTKGGGTALGYIDSWLRLLESPWLLTTDIVTLQAQESEYAHLSVKRLPSIKAALEGNGVAEAEQIVAQLQAGKEMEFPLAEKADLLSLILRVAPVSAWAVFQHLPYLQSSVPELGYLPAKSKKALEFVVPSFIRVGKDDYLRESGGYYEPVGWAYNVMGNFIAKEWEAEHRSHGSYRKRIAAMRQALESAPVDPDLRFEVLLDKAAAEAEGRYYAEMVDKVRAAVGVTSAGETFQISIGEDQETWNRITRLPLGAVKLRVINDVVDLALVAPSEQMALGF